MTTTTPDGSVVIDTKIDEKGFNAGMKRVTGSASNAFNNFLLKFAKVGVGLRNVISSIGAVLKKVLLGALIFFALSAEKIFGAIRESITDVIALAGDGIREKFNTLKNTFVEIKAAIGAAFLPVLIALLPILQKVADWLLTILNRAAMILAAFLGQKQVLQIVPGSAAKLAKEAEKTKKAAQGALAAFDQINVLAKPETATDANAPKVESTLVPVDAKSIELVDTVKDKIQGIKDKVAELKERWQNFIEGIVNSEPWKRTVEFVKNEWKDLQKTWDFIKQDFALLWEKIGPTLESGWARTKEFLIAEWEDLQVRWQQGVDFFKGLWEGIQPFFAVIWDTLVAVVKDKFKIFAEVWEAAKKQFQGWLDFIKGVFTGNWQLAWTGITNILKGTVEGWKAFFKGTINSVIDMINGLLRALVLGINAVANAISNIQIDIPDWVPVVGGQTLSFSVPAITAPQIPRLATGAVIPPNSQFLAVMGDQTAGRNIETPEGLLRQIVREEIGNIQANIEIGFTGSLAQLVRELKPHIDRENVRIGSNLIASGVTV